MKDHPALCVAQPLRGRGGQRCGDVAPFQIEQIGIEPRRTIEIGGDDVDMVERVDSHGRYSLKKPGPEAAQTNPMRLHRAADR